MSIARKILMGAAGVSGEGTYVDDVFSTLIFSGNNSYPRTVTNGINFSEEGGLIIGKARINSYGWVAWDTVRGAGDKALRIDSDQGENGAAVGPYVKLDQFNTDGFRLNQPSSQDVFNANGENGAFWSFRKTKGFLAIKEYTGSGSTQTLTHDLGSVPGFIIIKRTDSSANWAVYHRYQNVGADPEDYRLLLNSNTTENNDTYWGDTAPTDTQFTVGDAHSETNANGGTYIAYLFAGGPSTASGARSVEFETASNEFLNIPTSSSDMEMGTSDFTIETWIFPQDQDTSNFNCIFTCNTDFQLTWKERALKFYAPGISLTTGETYRVRQWHHVAVTRSGNTFRLFVNGELKDEGTSSSAIPGLSGYYPSIGAKNSSSEHFWGRISNLRLVKGTALYTSAFKPSTKPLTSVTNTKLLCCNGSTVTSATVTPATLNSSGTPVARPDSPFDDPAGFKFGDSNEGIIKCGSYNGSGSNNSDVYIGWEPSWVMMKGVSGNSNWTLFDNMRGVFAGGNDHMLRMNLDQTENSNFDQIEFTPTGFRLQGAGVNAGGTKYVYIAVRRSDGYVGKPPEVGTDVFAMDTGAGTTTIPNFDSGFPVDFSFLTTPAASGQHRQTGARLTGPQYMRLNGHNAESGHTGFTFDSNAGWGSQGDGSNWQSWMWKRHAGFDMVTYVGNLTAGHQIPHSLNKVPEMIWLRCRTITGRDWVVYHKGCNGGVNPWLYRLRIDHTDGERAASTYIGAAPTTTNFTVGASADSNGNGDSIIAFLFSSVDGISKVGYYDGSNDTLYITTGFQPRFLLVKRVNVDGDGWYIFDTTRGWASGGDEALLLNTTAAQVGSANYGEPTSTGFQLTWSGSGVNESGGKYIYYAHA